MAKKKKSWFKKNKVNLLWSIFVILLIGCFVLFWGINADETEKASVSDNAFLETEVISASSCSILISPSSITSGDDVTARIKTDKPLVFCEVFGKMNNDTSWLKVAEGTTDIDGQLLHTTPFSVVGDFIFAAICDGCRTNDDEITVIPAISSDCEDSDGINKMIAGNVKIDDVVAAYDECLDANTVKEYKCDDGLSHEVLVCDDGYECFETRSGGHCVLSEPEPECTDSDGGLVIEVTGICSSSASMTAIQDTCESPFVLSENICNPGTKSCETIVASCPPNTSCIGGACRPL